ncbi:MAG: type VII toxin-antitoxin system HepT family RNase toxin [Solirubrobacteraceae bacterium]
MVDGETAIARLARLERLIDQLGRVRAGGEEAYRADEDLRMMTERRLELAIQICIDIGAHLVSELSAPPPDDYAGIFGSLASAGHLDRDLAARLSAAARQRNLLVHLYLDIDDRKVFDSLRHLDDLRGFAAVVQRLVAPG